MNRINRMINKYHDDRRVAKLVKIYGQQLAVRLYNNLYSVKKVK